MLQPAGIFLSGELRSAAWVVELAA